MSRRRKAHPKRHQLCLRLTDYQLEILNACTELQGHASNVDAIRAMIDGLADWMQRQAAKQASEVSAPRTDSGLPPPPPVSDVEDIDVAPSDVEDIDVEDIDVEDIDGEVSTSVGDFGGRPHVGLPRLEGDDV